MVYEHPVKSSKVYFGAGFGGRTGRDHGGRRMELGCSFNWEGTFCQVPAYYLCAEGPVLDVLLRIQPEQLTRFSRRWGETLRTGRQLTDDEQLLLNADNPYYPDTLPRLLANGKALIPCHTHTARFNPHPSCCPPTTPEADALMELYHCDPSFGWLFIRTAFRWATRKKPALHELSLTLARQALLLPGPHLEIHAAGEVFRFIHPVTQTEHRFTVLSCLPDAQQRFRLSCTVSPALSDSELLIRDLHTAIPDVPDVPLLRANGSSLLHTVLSAPGEIPDWQLFFLYRRASSISLILSDDRVL